MSSNLSRTLHPLTAPAGRARYLTVCSGADNVGRSSLCINLAIALARDGKRVCILDTDPSISNAHHLLGISPAYSLVSVARGDCNMRDAINNGPGGIMLLHDGGYRAEVEKLKESQQRQLLHQLQAWQQQLDIVLIDTSATDASGLEAWISIADSLLMVLVPQSRSLSQSFSLLSQLSPSGKKKPMHVVVNRSSGSNQAGAIFEKFSSTVKKYLDTRLQYCGHIESDENIRNSVALQYPVALYDREDPSCARIFDLAAALHDQWTGVEPVGLGLVDLVAASIQQQRVDQPLWPEHSDTHQVTGGKAQFLQTPALADELIDRGLLGPEELKQVIEALLATAHHEFPATFPGPRGKAKTRVDEGNDGQRALLDKLRQSRPEGLTLDQLLYDHVRRK